jgi:hypothetical protein
VGLRARIWPAFERRKGPGDTPAGLRGYVLEYFGTFQTVSVPVDFSHSGAKGVGYARHRNLPKEVISRCLPYLLRWYRRSGSLRATFLKARLWARPGARGGRYPRPGQEEDRSLRPTSSVGLDQLKRFHRYHRVLSRADWSSRKASGLMLGLLLEAFVPEGSPLVVGIDETLERRYGRKISARGVYRDPVRSTHQTFVKSSGLRWVCAMLLVEIPWASRVWALPFLSVLAPSERYAARRGKRHKKIT